MNKINSLLIALFAVIIAQAQQGFNYKAVVTENGSILQNTEISVRFTILKASGAMIYQEKNSDVLTDADGIISVNIGEGSTIFGDFSTIDWSDYYLLKVEIETPANPGYVDLGTSALKSVPYAKYAENAENVSVKINDLNDAIHGLGSLFLGNGSGTGNSSGANNNTAVGKDALHSVNTGIYNTAMGYHSLYSNTTGDRNVSIGFASLEYNQDGDANIAIGTAALHQNLSGNDNIAIGNEAGYSALGSGNIFLGNHAGNTESGSNKLYIDNSNTSTPLIKGDFATDEITINGKLQVTEKLIAPNSGDSDMKAYAYGEYYNGSASHLSDNISNIFDAPATGEYHINFDNTHTGFANQYIVVASLSEDIGFIQIVKHDDDFYIYTYDTDGNHADKDFTFVVYKQ